MQENYYLTINIPEKTGDTRNTNFNLTIKARLSSDVIKTKVESDGKAALRIADFYTHNVVVEAENYNSGLMDAAYSTIDVIITDTITPVQTVQGEFKTYTQLEEDPNIKAKVYQNATLFLTKYENGKSPLSGIYGNPYYSYSYSYRVEGISKTIDGKSYGENLPENKANLKLDNTTDIRDWLAERSQIIVECKVRLTYTDASLPNQFPKRVTSGQSGETNTNGTAVSAITCIASNNNSMIGSATQANANDSNRNKFYCNDETIAKIIYNVPKGTSSDEIGVYNQLGINEKDMKSTDDTTIDAVALYDIGKLTDDEKNDYDHIKITMMLQRKLGDSNDYDELNNDRTNTLDLKQYMITHEDPKHTNNDGIECNPMKGVSNNITLERQYYDGNNKVFIFRINEGSKINGKIPDTYMFSTLYKIKTGADFEDDDLIYSNYRVTLNAELFKYNGSEECMSDTSKAQDYLVYTNAKLITKIVS